MAAAQLDTVLRHLRGLTPAADDDLGDGALLQRFAAGGDPGAFNVLVQRYSRLVWGVCRNVLGHHHDAEDAFQATFLILARSAATIRQTAAVAGWLHGVAYRTAMRAKRDAARRRQREQAAGARQPTTEVSEASLRDLQAVLDEEVARLPEKLRTPFVLCALDGKSGAEAARLLGCPVGTVSARLTHARQRLRQRLARRGVALTAVLCAVEVGRAAPPPALAREAVRAICAAAVSAVAGSPGLQTGVISLAEGVTRTMLATRTRILTTLLLALGLLAATTYQLSAVGPRQEQPPRAAPRPADRPGDAVTVRGRVLDPDGKPLANARLYWPRLLRPELLRTRADITIVQVGRSDAKGRFAVKLQRIKTPNGRPLSLVATADGYGLGWANVRMDAPPGELTLRLVKDQPIRGRVLSTEGKPIAGATIEINGVFSGRQGTLDPFLVAWKAEWRSAFQKTDRLYLPLEKVIAIAPSDRDGRFEIKGVGAERLVNLQVRAAGFAQESVYVVNRTGFDPEPYNKAAEDRFPPALRRPGMIPKLAGPTFRLVAGPTRVIEGVVKEAVNGKPLAGVSLLSIAGYNNGVYAVSDAKGHYRISGLPKSKDYSLHATPPGQSALMMRSVRITDDGGLGTIKLDIEMMRGVVLTGRVIDRATSKGVRADLRFAPLPDNKFFGKPGYDSYRYEHLAHETKADGSYRLAVIPGSGVLMVQAYGNEKELGGLSVKPWMRATLTAAERKRVPLGEDGRFTAAGNALEFLNIENACKVLDLAPDAGTVKCDLFVERGKTLRVRIQDAEGKPLSGATIGGMTASWPIVFPLKDASCTVYALDPQRPRTLVFYHAGRKLAGKLTVRGDEKEPPAVRLSAVGSVRGRLVDLDDQPLAGIEVRPSYRGDAARELGRQLNQGREAIRTDKDGRFRVDGVIPDMKFGLSLTKGRTYFVGEPRIGQRQVASGKELDLGTLHVKPAN